MGSGVGSGVVVGWDVVVPVLVLGWLVVVEPPDEPLDPPEDGVEVAGWLGVVLGVLVVVD